MEWHPLKIGNALELGKGDTKETKTLVSEDLSIKIPLYLSLKKNYYCGGPKSEMGHISFMLKPRKSYFNLSQLLNQFSEEI